MAPIEDLIAAPIEDRTGPLTGHSRSSRVTTRSVVAVSVGPKTAIRFASAPPETAKVVAD